MSDPPPTRRNGIRRGKLKIFFGMCPGVGKTYAMLEAAQQQLANGVEVIAGIVETHGRPETARLLEGIPIVPLTDTKYRGVTLREMDLDALLVWHAGLVLVDELAHSNAPGSRHPKRYQDVLELLEAGNNVYTTLNVQHVESRKDTVRQITGVEVRETVPDSMLDFADEIALIDLSPSQLLTRLAEGKVYFHSQAATAADRFFREANLIALREMSLRLTAEHVDRDLRQIKGGGAGEPWKAGDRLMVAISGSPTSEKLIRWTRRAASSMEASWIAVHVETPDVTPSTLEEVRLSLNLALARQLGAEVILSQGSAVGPTLLRVAQQHNVTQIVLGKPASCRWFAFLKRSPVPWLIFHSGEIDVQLVQGLEAKPSAKPSANHAFPAHALRLPVWRDYLFATGIALGVTVLGSLLEPLTGYWAIALLYLLVVILCSFRFPRWPTLYLASLSALLWDLWFIPPRFTLIIREVRDFVTFVIYFIVVIVVSHLTTRLREREQAERRGEARATALYRLSRGLAASRDQNETVATTVRCIGETFDAECALFTRNENGEFSGAPHPASTLALGTNEESVAAWVFQHNKPAGRTTETLPDASALYLPLFSGGNIEGVLAFKPSGEGPLPIRRRELLEAFAAQIAVTLEKDRLLSASRKAMARAQSEKFQHTLFDTLSHELKAPLDILVAGLKETDGSLPRKALRAANRLTQVVNHLLEMTRLESGLLKPTLAWSDPGELLNEALERVRDQTQSHSILLKIASDLPSLHVDPELITQALTILLSNASLYSPPESEIEASAIYENTSIQWKIADRGIGLRPGDEERVFQRFYRGEGEHPGGIGLGLSIARHLIEMHQGTITARNRNKGGAEFTVTLSASETLRLPEKPSGKEI